MSRRGARDLAGVARDRWIHLTRHPLTRDQPLRAVGRYVRFHLSQVLRPHVIEVPFVDGSRLLARRGVGGSTDHLFVHLGDVEEMALLHHVLRPGDRFVDVGANVGGYSVLAAMAGADVIACEPGEAVTMLRQVVAANELGGRCRVEPVAVGATEGTVELTTGRDSLNRVVAGGEGTTPLRTLDDLCGDRPPFAVKVDVEGYELEVLQGAGDLLASGQVQVLVVELNGSGRTFGVTDEQVHRHIVGQGFTPVRYEPLARRLTVADSWDHERFNTIYVRDVALVDERVATAAPLVVGPHRL